MFCKAYLIQLTFYSLSLLERTGNYAIYSLNTRLFLLTLVISPNIINFINKRKWWIFLYTNVDVDVLEEQPRAEQKTSTTKQTKRTQRLNYEILCVFIFKMGLLLWAIKAGYAVDGLHVVDSCGVVTKPPPESRWRFRSGQFFKTC